jgi:hypothetical protein
MKTIIKGAKENKEFTLAMAFAITLVTITVYNAITFGTHNPF